MDFTDKVVLITGASKGIGKSTAVLFARHGAKVVVNARENPGETLELICNERGEGIFLPGDVSKSEDAQRIVSETVERFGRLDILINNAGIVIPGRVDNTSEEDFDITFAINVKGTFMMSKYAVLQMKKQGYGVIVNNASVAAIKGHLDRGCYSASKGAVLALTKSMAADYAKENIRVNCVCPGTVYSPSLAERIKSADDPEAMEQMFVSRHPIGRIGQPEEIASAILFACCDEAAFMTGSNIVIDGGMTV